MRAILALRQIATRIKPDIAHHSGLQCCVFGAIAAFGRTFPYVSALTGQDVAQQCAAVAGVWIARHVVRLEEILADLPP